MNVLHLKASRTPAGGCFFPHSFSPACLRITNLWWGNRMWKRSKGAGERRWRFFWLFFLFLFTCCSAVCKTFHNNLALHESLRVGNSVPASMRVWALTEEAATALLFFVWVCFFLLFGRGHEEAGRVGWGQQRLRVFLTASATRENSNEASSPNYSPAVGFSVCVCVHWRLYSH